MVPVSKLYDDLFLRKAHFGLKHLFVFRGPNSAHPEVLRCANCNGTSFKAVWWSVSEKTHFGLKHHFPLYLEGQTQHTLRVSEMFQSQWYQFQSCMMICFWENTFWAKTSLSFVFREPNSAHPEVLRCANHNGTIFKAVWWSVSEKEHFGLKHHFPFM